MNFEDSKSISQPKRLKETLLEWAVFNFYETFFEKVIDLGQICVKKDILLPCGLFESILEKSKELHWMIPLPYLKLCLGARDKLVWKNIDLTYRNDFRAVLVENDLRIIASSPATIRSLCFFADWLPSRSLNYLSKLNGLKILEIKYQEGRPHNFDWTELPRKIKLRNLEEFTISFTAVHCDFLLNLDLEDCSRSLRSLKVIDIYDDHGMQYPLMKSLGSFVNLRHLSLNNARLDMDDVDTDLQNNIINPFASYFENINNLKHLKTLHLSGWKVPEQLQCEQLLKDLLAIVKSIKNLDVNKSSFAANHHVWLTRRLKYLGIYTHKFIDDIINGEQIHPTSIQADIVGAEYNLESVITHMETSIVDQYDDDSCLMTLGLHLKHVPEITDDTRRRIEKVLLIVFDKHIQSYIDTPAMVLNNIKKIQNCDDIFMRKICTIVLSSMNCEFHCGSCGDDYISYCNLDISHIHSHMLKLMVEECNSSMMKAFLESTHRILEQRPDLRTSIFQHLKCFGIITFFKKMKKVDGLDKTMQNVIRNIMSILYSNINDGDEYNVCSNDNNEMENDD